MNICLTVLATLLMSLVIHCESATLAIVPDSLSISDNATGSVVNVTVKCSPPAAFDSLISLTISRNLTSNPNVAIQLATATIVNTVAQMLTIIPGASASGSLAENFVTVTMTQVSCNDAGTYMCIASYFVDLTEVETSMDAKNFTLQGYEVRLSGGDNPSQGRVEIKINCVWGTVCDDYFGVREAVVICRMLGYIQSTPKVTTDVIFPPFSGPIHLDDVICYGNESNILDCEHQPVGIHNCGHWEDVGINCLDASSNCPSNSFCDSGQCISISSLCDGSNECYDGADENQCGHPTNSKEMSGLQVIYGAHVNMPFRIDFQVEGSPNAQINSVLVVTDERQRTYLQNNRHWNHTSVKSTFLNSKYVTNVSLELHNVTSDVIDCQYYLNVSDASGFTTFSFVLRWIAIPSDADGTIPVKYIHFDALKNSTIALIIKIKSYPEPHLSDIIGVGTKGENHSVLPKWTHTFQKEDHRPFTTTFTLQSQYRTGDVLYQKYFAVIKNWEGSTTIQFRLISQAESNATHENPLKTAVIALVVVIFVVFALAVVYKISGQSLPNFLMRRKPVTNQYMGLEPVVHFNNATPEDGSEIYDEIPEKFEDPQDVLHLEDGYNVISGLSTDYEEALHVEDGYLTILNEHASSSMCDEFASDRSRGANSLGNGNSTGEAMVNVSLQLDSKPDTDGVNDYLKNSSLGSVSSEYLEPVHIGNTTEPPALSPDYLRPVFVSSGALDDESNEDQPPALSPDSLHRAFAFSGALDGESNEDQPPALSPDSLHRAFAFSGSMDEDFNEDHANNDKLSESENCQAELSDTMI